MSASIEFNNFPAEIVWKIGDYDWTGMLNLRRVCKQFNAIFNDLFFWKKAYTEKYSAPGDLNPSLDAEDQIALYRAFVIQNPDDDDHIVNNIFLKILNSYKFSEKANLLNAQKQLQKHVEKIKNSSSSADTSILILKDTDEEYPKAKKQCTALLKMCCLIQNDLEMTKYQLKHFDPDFSLCLKNLSDAFFEVRKALNHLNQHKQIFIQFNDFQKRIFSASTNLFKTDVAQKLFLSLNKIEKDQNLINFLLYFEILKDKRTLNEGERNCLNRMVDSNSTSCQAGMQALKCAIPDLIQHFNSQLPEVSNELSSNQ